MARARLLSLIRGFLVTIFIALVFLAPAFADSFVLHPAAFGKTSYAAWKAGEGLTDNNGANHALYFQKLTATATFAAGVAVFKGFAGLPASDITTYTFWVRDDGHCGAGAPRFNVFTDTAGVRQNFFLGCFAMLAVGAPVMAPNGHFFQKKSGTPLQFFPSPPTGTIISIAIVFDEGTDAGVGFVHLDNIELDSTSTGAHIWTGPADNADPADSATIFDTAIIESLIGAPLTTLSVTTPF